MSSVTTSSASTGDRVLGALQSVGRSLMLPIAVLPAAALLLRLGQADLLGSIHWGVIHLDWIAKAGDAIFSNLPLIFAIGIAIGLSGGEGSAALAAVVGFLVFTAVFNNIIPQVKAADGTLSPDPNISMGVLSGILMGIVSAGLYKKFYDLRLPDYLGFFGGRRFVPIVTAFAALLLGLIFGIIWPPINSGINAFGTAIVSLGAVGAGIYGFLNRLLIPTGLHHVLNSYFWFQLGSFKGPDGTIVHGDLNRYFAGDTSAGYYMAGFFPMMMFGLPAACIAMIRHAKYPKVAAGILVSAAVASLVTGITEPIEFAFLFVAPVLFVVHAILTGTALAVCYLLQIKIGFGFSAGLIDFLINFNKSNTTNPWLLLLVGVVYGVIYYFVFSFFIVRFNLGTPGRGEESTGLAPDWILPESQRKPVASKNATAAATGEADDKETILAREVLSALGGKENIESLEGCITRLRIFVSQPDKIDEPRLKSLGSSGVIKRGKIVQVVMGTQSDRIASRINRLRKEGNVEV